MSSDIFVSYRAGLPDFQTARLALLPGARVSYSADECLGLKFSRVEWQGLRKIS